MRLTAVILDMSYCVQGRLQVRTRAEGNSSPRSRYSPTRTWKRISGSFVNPHDDEAKGRPGHPPHATRHSPPATYHPPPATYHPPLPAHHPPPPAALSYKLFRYINLAHVIMYIGIEHRISCLGLSGMVKIGLLTESEARTLEPTGDKMRDTALGWISIEIEHGFRTGVLNSASATPLLEALKVRDYQLVRAEALNLLLNFTRTCCCAHMTIARARFVPNFLLPLLK